MPNYIEPVEEFTGVDRDIHRSLNSLKEEIDAIEWYHQRAATASDPEIKLILIHNLEEEIEHACMILEWLRRHFPGWDEGLKTYLFTTQPITGIEQNAMTDAPKTKDGGAEGLGIGGLK